MRPVKIVPTTEASEISTNVAFGRKGVSLFTSTSGILSTRGSERTPPGLNTAEVNRTLPASTMPAYAVASMVAAATGGLERVDVGTPGRLADELAEERETISAPSIGALRHGHLDPGQPALLGDAADRTTDPTGKPGPALGKHKLRSALGECARPTLQRQVLS